MKQLLHRLDIGKELFRVAAITAIGIMLAASLGQMLFTQNASAAQLTSRKLTLSSSKISETGVNYTFAFTPAGATTIQSIDIQFCTTPLGTCTQPTGLSTASYTIGAQTFDGATAFTAQATNTGGCTVTTLVNYEVCVKRTDATSEAATAKSLTIGGMVNMSTQSTVYARIVTYSDNAFATPVDNGVVAAATARQLTVNGRVQERLEFCVAAITDAAALPADCSTMGSTTTIDLGVVDNVSIAKAPVDTTATNGANDSYGVAMINTNASNGAILTYFPETAASGTNQLTSFRVTGATCDALNTNLTDQCFQNAATTGTVFAAGTEDFGMYVPCIDTTQGTTTNLGSVPAAYSGTDGVTTIVADCENEAGVKFGWNTATTTIASSSSVIDDEIVKLRFGAAAASTTPTGSYTVVTNYIATPTF